MPLLERHIAFYGEAPRQAAADGGYASRENLRQAKAWGVRDMAFHKKSGLRIEDMVRSRWVYRKLRNFRTGIEAGISCLKRTYGLARCTWRGLDHFKTYVWSSVVAYNLALFARLRPTYAGHRAAFRNTPRAPADATRPYRRQIALRSQPASPVPSRLAKKDRFSEQNTSKTLKNRRLWTGTRLGDHPRPRKRARPSRRTCDLQKVQGVARSAENAWPPVV
ncbi:hypothetical protein ACVI1N_000053 [Sinorhizobium medicae]